ncbi:hypothetical protein ACLKMY_15985 [Paraburkholderia mimosarum]|uniref:hypothetical protein n=1 Tax=Paraburkholderia mimosarum TaxID=312026 RepID=UPI0039C0E2AD
MQLNGPAEAGQDFGLPLEPILKSRIGGGFGLSVAPKNGKVAEYFRRQYALA